MVSSSFRSLCLNPLALAAALTSLSVVPVYALQPAGAVSRAAAPASTDQLIIKYRDVATPKRMLGAAAEAQPSLQLAQAAAQRHGLNMRVLRAGTGNALVMKLDRRVNVEQVRQLARDITASDLNVAFAEPDHMRRVALVPNDASFGNQWGYTSVAGGGNFLTAWDINTGAGVTVAVIDTGYRPHADLSANVVAGYDFISDLDVAQDGNGRDADALDPGDFSDAGDCGEGSEESYSSWHGTHVAGTVAALTNNSIGVAGGAFGAKVQPVRALGRCGGYDSDIADAIVWASGGTISGVPANPTPARVINLSLGGSGSCGSYTQSAIDAARSRNSVLVVAAGNDASDAVDFSPANCKGVITVGAVGRTGVQAYYSNFGYNVQISAPGGDQTYSLLDGILSTANSGLRGPELDAYRFYEGTSMAAPHVAAAVALMLSRNPTLTPNQVASRLKVSAKFFPSAPGVCWAGYCGVGIVDAYRSVYSATVPIIGETPQPHNTLGTAQVLTQPQIQVSGKILSSTELDYYKIALPAGKIVVLSLSPSFNRNDFDIQLVNSSGTVLASSLRSAGLTDRVNYTNPGATTMNVYARVKPFFGTGDYTLMVRR